MPLAVHVFKSSIQLSKIIAMFKKAEIEVFVGGEITKIDSDHRFFKYDYGFTSILNTYEDADFVIIASEHMKVEWDKLEDELKRIEEGIYSNVELLKSAIHVEKLAINIESKNIAPEQPPIDGEYRYRTFHAEKLDIKLYEVTRPGTEKPFTVVVNDVSTKGDLYFFTDIYGSKEWDMNRRECRFDYLFLTNLWEHLKMPGEFTMNFLKERTERCYPGKLAEGQIPEAEPIVYRKSIEDVKQVLKRRYGDFS